MPSPRVTRGAAGAAGPADGRAVGQGPAPADGPLPRLPPLPICCHPLSPPRRAHARCPSRPAAPPARSPASSTAGPCRGPPQHPHAATAAPAQPGLMRPVGPARRAGRADWSSGRRLIAWARVAHAPRARAGGGSGEGRLSEHQMAANASRWTTSRWVAAQMAVPPSLPPSLPPFLPPSLPPSLPPPPLTSPFFAFLAHSLAFCIFVLSTPRLPCLHSPHPVPA